MPAVTADMMLRAGVLEAAGGRPITTLQGTTRGQPGVDPVKKPVRPRPLKPRTKKKKSIPQPKGFK